MKVLEAFDTLRKWFLGHNIKIDPDKFEVVLRFKDIQEYAAFESSVRHDVNTQEAMIYFHQGDNWYIQRGQLMGVSIIVEAPGNCSCYTCVAVRKVGWRAP